MSYAEVPLWADDLLGYSWPYLLKSRTCTGLRAYSLVCWEERKAEYLLAAKKREDQDHWASVKDKVYTFISNPAFLEMAQSGEENVIDIPFLFSLTPLAEFHERCLTLTEQQL